MTTRFVYTLALLQAVLLTGILILNPWFARRDSPALRSNSSVETIIPINPTPADVVLDYANTTQKITTTPPAGITLLAEVEEQIFNLTNEQRRQLKLPLLNPDASLQTAARSHSIDMLERDFFDHTSPDGKTPFDRIAIIHRTLIGTVGENIWSSQGLQQKDAKLLAVQVMKDWLGSPGHRANLLRNEYTHLGVGAASKGNILRVTQNFASTQALFQQDLPLEINKGATLPLATTPVAQKTSPVQYEYWLSDKGVAATPPIPITNTQITVAPGDYRLRLYFNTVADKGRSGYVIYSGPQVVVK